MQPPAGTRKIQVALLLDASGSMDDLLDQARGQLWNMVRVLSDANCTGKKPTVEVALYAYGLAAPKEEGYLRRLLPFTQNTDSLSAALSSLKANGSDEWCGLVLHRALTELAWDSNPQSYKAIFIAGNESFDEGPYPAATALREAVDKHVLVNTIFCGPESDTKFYNWKVGNGTYARIDLYSHEADPETPYDKALISWNNRLQQSNARAIPKQKPGAESGSRDHISTPIYGAYDLDIRLPDSTHAARLRVDSLHHANRNRELQASIATTETDSTRRSIRAPMERLARQRNAWLLANKSASSHSADSATLQAQVEQTLRQQLAAKGFRMTPTTAVPKKH